MSRARRLAARQRRGTGRSEDVIPFANDRAAALHVEKGIVPGVANLSCEQAEGVDARAVAVTCDYGATREDQADVVARKVSPVALGFKAEHPVAGLLAIADLATSRAAGALWQPSFTRPPVVGSTKSQQLCPEPPPPLMPM